MHKTSPFQTITKLIISIMITKLTLMRDKERVQRDPCLATTKVTILCGPNGSGKSTFLDALHALINGRPTNGKQWTAETAPLLVEGDAQAVMTFSFERDNPRMLNGHNLEAGQVVMRMLSNERSHGQSNFGQLEAAFEHPVVDVLVLDEPESALDLDGLLWLREKILATDKQVIIATHSIAILSLVGKSEDISVHSFGKEEAYFERLIASYHAISTGKRVLKPKKRLALPKFAPARKTSSQRRAGARKFFEGVMQRR